MTSVVSVDNDNGNLKSMRQKIGEKITLLPKLPHLQLTFSLLQLPKIASQWTEMLGMPILLL